MSDKKRKYGDAWKNVTADKTEVEQMNAIFDRFVSPLDFIPKEKEENQEVDILVSSDNTVASFDELHEVIEPIEPHIDHLNNQIDSYEPITQVCENLVPIELSSQNQVLLEPSSINIESIELSPNRTKISENQPAKFYTIQNSLADELLPTLPPYEQLVFLRLYRLSFGFNRKKTDPVSYSKLAAKCNLSVSTVKRSLQGLEAKKLIKVTGDTKHNPLSGNQYELLINLAPIEPSSNRTMPTEVGSNRTKFSQTSIKDHDDLLKEHDHHQSEHEKAVMMIYQKITNNSWTKADITSYQKIKNIPLESIEMAIKLATQRAATRPNSLAYFVKEIINTANPPKQNRNLRKKIMEKIVDRVRNSFVGSSYTMSDFTYKVKDLCIKEDIYFDNDIFDEILAKKK